MRRRDRESSLVAIVAIALGCTIFARTPVALAAGAPETDWVEAVTLDAAADTNAVWEPFPEASLLDSGGEAALLAAQLLLSADVNCAVDRCENLDGACKACARPVSDGGSPTASDALGILRVAVGDAVCSPCVCDVDDSGAIVATDALLTLKSAVGQQIDLICPAG